MYSILTVKDLENDVAIDEINMMYKTGKISKGDYEKLMSEIKQKDKES